MGPAQKVNAAHIEGDARAEARLAGRRFQAGAAAADARQLSAEAESQRIFTGFFNLEQHKFIALFSLGILQHRINLGEDPKLIEPALGFKQIRLGDRIAGMQRYAFTHHLRAGRN